MNRNRPKRWVPADWVSILIRPPPIFLRGVPAKEAPPLRRGSKTTEIVAQGAIKSLSAKRFPFAGAQANRTLDRDKILAAGAPPPSAGGVPTSSFGTTGQHRKGENRVFAGRGSGHPRVAGDRKPHKTSEESDRDCRKQETWARPPLGGPLAKAGVLPSTLFWVGGYYGIKNFLGIVFLSFSPFPFPWVAACELFDFVWEPRDLS